MRKLGKAALAAALACSLCPIVPAYAADASASGSGRENAAPAFEPGTYVEHEAIALVLSGAGAQGGPSLLSEASGLLDGAQSLMDVSADAAARAFGEDADAAAQEAAGAGVQLLSAATADVDESDANASASTEIVLVRDDSLTTEEIVAALKADSRVIAAEPNWLIEQADDAAGEWEGGVADEASGVAEVSGVASAPGATDSESAPTLLADDGSLYPDGNDVDLTRFQWAYDNDGVLGGAGTQGIDMGYAGWSESSGQADDSIVVAVIDTGVDASNPDLAPVMWTDDGTHPGLAGMGGDKHGLSYATDAQGNRLTSYEGITEGHGTHVAGSIAAAWNGEGVSGLAQNAKIMALRFGGSTATVFKCFEYVKTAVEEGVNVRATNNSWTLGANQTQIANAAVLELGGVGVACVFGTGNSTTDMDGQSMMAGTLADNPYAAIVNSIDATGAMSIFSNYGTITTDVMAPGSTILSTWPTNDLQYLAEGDEVALVYQSFDDASRASLGLPAGTQLEFSQAGGKVVSDKRAFEGTSAMEFPYSPEAADADGFQWYESDTLNLSALSQWADCLSFRLASGDQNAEGTLGVESKVQVKLADRTWADATSKGSFRSYGDAWGGAYVDIPENADFANFQVRIGLKHAVVHCVGGPRTLEPTAGTVLLDSIGIGSEEAKVPYAYLQGTSMACPAACGALAAIAYRYPSDSPDKLIARLLGSSSGRAGASWEDYCQTGGVPSVDAADAPSPVVSSVTDEGSTLAVKAWFAGADAAVSVAGKQVKVVSSTAGATAAGAPDADVRVFTVEKPSGFTGGVTEVSVTTDGGKSGRIFAPLGNASDDVLYDNVNLPVFDGAEQYGIWRLAGFAGNVYFMSAFDILGLAPANVMYRYAPATKTWEAVTLPESLIDELGVGMCGSLAAATLDGQLVVQVSGNGVAYAAYHADGTWSVLAPAGSIEGVVSFSALGSDGKSLYGFGGLEGGKESTAITRIDLAAGVAERIGDLPQARYEPTVAYSDGAFVVSGGWIISSQMAGATGADFVELAADGSAKAQAVDMSALVKATGQLMYGSAAAADGFILVGPESIDGAADTYTLSAKMGALPVPYGKRASSLRLQTTAALAYEGNLYAFSSVAGMTGRSFNATAVETAAQPGDYVAPEPEPSPDPEPAPDPEPTPAPEPDPSLGPDSASDADAAADAGEGATLAQSGDSLPLAALGAVVVAALGVAIAVFVRLHAKPRGKHAAR